MLTPSDFDAIIANVEYSRPGREMWEIRLGSDDDRFYLQVYSEGGIDSTNGKPLSWSGRKWWLSQHMCVSEVVRTIFKAIQAAEEHELCENFRYKGETIYDPHRNVDLLVDAAYRRDSQDTREGRNSKI